MEEIVSSSFVYGFVVSFVVGFVYFLAKLMSRRFALFIDRYATRIAAVIDLVTGHDPKEAAAYFAATKRPMRLLMPSPETTTRDPIRDALKHCISFMQNEMDWEYFRADFDIGNSVSHSARNAMKLSVMLRRLRDSSPELDTIFAEVSNAR